MINQTKKLLRSVIDAIARKASRNYIAGPNLEDAQRVSRYLSNRGYWVTQGYWDDGSDAPEQVVDTYLSAIDQLRELDGENYLSLKIPALHYNAEMYKTVLTKSRQSHIPIHFDSLAPEHVNRTQTFIKEHTEAPLHDIGYTLPGRWERSIKDADLVNELGLNVRVVKGQWEDPDYPNRDPRSGFLKVIDRLAGKASCVRVATHDTSLANDALSRLKATNTPCELELLYGLPITNLVSIADELDVPVRIYIAFGHAYLPYAISSLRKQPAMILKLIKEAYKQNYLSSFPVCTSNN